MRNRHGGCLRRDLTAVVALQATWNRFQAKRVIDGWRKGIEGNPQQSGAVVAACKWLHATTSKASLARPVQVVGIMQIPAFNQSRIAPSSCALFRNSSITNSDENSSVIGSPANRRSTSAFARINDPVEYCLTASVSDITCSPFFQEVIVRVVIALCR